MNELAMQGCLSVQPRKGINSAVTREKASMTGGGGWQLHIICKLYVPVCVGYRMGNLGERAAGESESNGIIRGTAAGTSLLGTLGTVPAVGRSTSRTKAKV